MIERDKDGYLVLYPNEDTTVLAGRARVITTDVTLDKVGLIIPTSPFGMVSRVIGGAKVAVTITNNSNKHILIRKDDPICHVLESLGSAKPIDSVKPIIKPKISSAKPTTKKPVVVKPTIGEKK